jgi:hypothetical protein
MRSKFVRRALNGFGNILRGNENVAPDFNSTVSAFRTES